MDHRLRITDLWYVGIKHNMGGLIVVLWFFCPSDDSNDSDGSLEEGLSFEPTNHHAACKDEPCDQEDSLDDAKPLNGVLLQGKGQPCCDNDRTTDGFSQPLPSRCTVFHVYVLTLSIPLISTDPKADKASLYNFSKLKKNRKWLKVFYFPYPTRSWHVNHMKSHFLCIGSAEKGLDVHTGILVVSCPNMEPFPSNSTDDRFNVTK